MASKGVVTGVYALYALHATTTLHAAVTSRRWPGRRAPSLALGAILGICGIGIYAAGLRRFQSLQQVSGLERGELVTGGIYRYSRNPQLAGWSLALGGAALAGRSSRALLFVALFLLAHEMYLPVEERHLECAFGEEYRRYRAEVPRYL